jgi:hypothetical protein
LARRALLSCLSRVARLACGARWSGGWCWSGVAATNQQR